MVYLCGDASGGRSASSPELRRVGASVTQLTTVDSRALHLHGALDPAIFEAGFFGSLGNVFLSVRLRGNFLPFGGLCFLLLVSLS